MAQCPRHRSNGPTGVPGFLRDNQDAFTSVKTFVSEESESLVVRNPPKSIDPGLTEKKRCRDTSAKTPNKLRVEDCKISDQIKTFTQT